MPNISLDSSIGKLDLSRRTENILFRSGIYSIEVLLSLDIPNGYFIRNMGTKTKEEIISKVHQKGFAFVGEEGYKKQLVKHICQKLGIDSLPIKELTLDIKKRMLSLTELELTEVVLPQYRKVFDAYPAMYKGTQLKDILDVHIYKKQDQDWYLIADVASANFVRTIGRDEEGNSVMNGLGTIYWIKAIHELGFYFGDEPGYEKLMQELELIPNNPRLSKEQEFLLSASKILSLTYTMSDEEQNKFMESLKEYPELREELLMIYPDNPILLKAKELMRGDESGRNRQK